MDGLNTGLGTGEDSGKSALDRYAGGAVSGPVSLNGGVAFGAPAAFLGAGNNIRLSYNQNGNDAYVYQGAGNGLNLSTGSYQDVNGVSTASAAQGSIFGVSSNGTFNFNVFSGATIGSTPTQVNIASFAAAAATFNIPLSSTGVIAAAGELQSTSGNALRMVNGNYGAILRNDGSDVYLLSTPSGGQYGTWNNFRPFTYNLASGAINFDGTGAGVTFGGAGSFGGALSAAGTASFASTLGVSGAANLQSTLAVAGLSTLSGGVTVNGTSSFNAGAYWGSSGNRALIYQGAAGNLAISTNRDGASAYYFLFGADGSFSTNGGALNAGATNVGALTSGSHTVGGGVSTTGNISAGGAMSAAGSITSQASGNGYVALEPGSTANPGYVAFFTADNTRRGYIGWQTGTDYLSIESENGWNYNFSQRPLFAGYTPWDSGNFTPSNYQPAGSYQAALGYTPVNKAGDTMTGTLSVLSSSIYGHEFSFSSNTAFHDFHTANSYIDYDARILASGPASPSGVGQATLSYTAAAHAFNVRPSFNGATPWDSANFTPSNYQPAGSYQASLGYTPVNKAGDTMTGLLGFSGTGLQVGSGATQGLYGDGTNIALRGLNQTGSTIFFQSYNGSTTYATFSSTACNFSEPLQQNGNQVWHAGNFTPSNYQPAGSYQAALGYTPVNKAGDTMTGTLNAPNLQIGGVQVARVQSGSGGNSGLISWGTGTPGALAVGQIYFQVAAT